MSRQLRVIRGRCGEVGQQSQVRFDLRRDPRLLHLDDHFLAGMQAGDVRLPDRGGRERFVVEPGEEFIDRFAEFRFDLRADRFHRHRWHPIPQFGEFEEISRGQQVGSGGEDLTELDRGGAELLDRQSQADRVRHRIDWLVRSPLALHPGKVPAKPELIDQRGQAVPAHHPGDFGQPGSA
ncbi:MAG: hypothetical protein R2843_00775 [Thermomicrobiales bacterium]